MQGKLVRLRAYEKADADALVRWFSDDEVTRWLGPMNVPISRAKQEAFIEMAAESRDDAKYFASKRSTRQAGRRLRTQIHRLEMPQGRILHHDRRETALGQGLRRRRPSHRDSIGVRKNEPESTVAHRLGGQSPRGQMLRESAALSVKAVCGRRVSLTASIATFS